MLRAGNIVEIEGDGPGPQSAVVIWADDVGRQVRIVTERGREQKLAATKVLLDTGQRVSSLARAPDQLGVEVRKFARDADETAAQVDVQTVWELCLADTAGEFPVDTLSELAFSEAGGLQRAAMLRALCGDSLYFRRHGTSFAPRPRTVVEDTLRQRRVATERATARDALIEWLRESARAGASGARPSMGPPPAGSESWLTALETLACGGELTGAQAEEIPDIVRQVDPGGGGGPDEAALRVLQAAGLIGADENLALRRHHLPVEFGEAALAHAAQAATRRATLDADPDGLPRRDLRAQCTFTIDGAETTEIDDALAVEARAEGGHRVYIHISDVGFFVERDDPVDREAQRRSTALYLPERRVAMVPAALGEDAASLRAGVDRPTLTFVVDLDAAGTPVGFEYFTALVRVRARLTYDEVDTVLARAEGGEAAGDAEVTGALRTLATIARRLVLARVARGGVILRGLEVEPRVSADGVITVVKHDAESPARLTVSELMILAGAQTAEHFRERALPGVFRKQPEPDEPLPPLGPDDPYQPELVYELRRKLKPTGVDVRPGRHSTLGLDAYTQVTSPIRRFQDLVMHRQLRALLRGEAPPYTVDALREVAATTEQAGRVARQVEQASDQYWLLKHLGGRRGELLEAVIVRVDRARTFVELCDYGLTLPIPLTPTHHAGERLLLEVRKTHPRRGTALVQEIGGRDAG